MNKWILADDAPPEFYNKHPELPPIVTRLLWNRQILEQEKIDEFLNPDYGTDIHDPFLFIDMEKAVKIIMEAIEGQKQIVVHGDYDADGVSAAAIIIKTLQVLGAKNVSVFIPHRETDGYGLNINTVTELVKNKTDLLITCDCGISNAEEIDLAKKNKIAVIITDHHSIPETIPKADAIIHPKMPEEKYPDKTICGAAVAFKLVQALLHKHQQTNSTLPDGQLHEPFEKWLLDLVALATVADMVPLLGESRTLVRYGLLVLNKTQNKGLHKLLEISGLINEDDTTKNKISTQNLGFQIVPRINAAGRMDHANTAFALLMSDNDQETRELAEQLNVSNVERKKITNTIVKEAMEQMEAQKDNPVLFAHSKGWNTGILGLVAGRLKDQYYKPVIILGTNNGEITGSGRSIFEFNLIEALQEMPKMFDKFGGHPQACGLTLAKDVTLEQFQTALIENVTKKLKNVELVPQIHVDAEVNLEEVDWKLYDILQRFEPFGMKNEEPKYVAFGITVTDIQPVGQDGSHLRMMVKHNNQVIHKTIAFGLGDITRHPADWKNNLKIGDKIDMVFTVGVNEWNGNRELQLSIEDIRHSK